MTLPWTWARGMEWHLPPLSRHCHGFILGTGWLCLRSETLLMSWRYGQQSPGHGLEVHHGDAPARWGQGPADDLRQTHRDRPLSQPLSHPPARLWLQALSPEHGPLQLDAGTRCWDPRRKNRNPPSVHPVGPPSEKLQRSGAVAATIGVCRRNRNCHVDSCGRRRKKERANAKPRRETVDTAIDYVQITSGPNFRSGAVDTGSGLTSMRACADCSRGRLDAPCGGEGLFVFISEDQIAPRRG